MSDSDRDIIRKLGPVGNAFFGRFHELREVQRRAIPPILAGRNVLVSSATASGKTEAVFAPLAARIRALPPPANRASRILAVAPTRALVNDLHARLERPLFELGWSCGRQTSDHREKHLAPEVLITTPESFDSMLVRDGVRERGELIRHLLAGVEAVFVDEAHLFETSARGDQVAWLLGRMRRLKKHALSRGWVANGDIQTCGASATLPNPVKLAEKLLGGEHTVVQVSGSREMELFCTLGPDRWVRFETLKSLDETFTYILPSGEHEGFASILNLIWASIENGADDGNRKVLVFVPSRALCDKLSLALSDVIRRRRDMFVGAHHGSLERSLREQAEYKFMNSRDAVLVATTTLEVGIDIGDVDVVALVGCPPGTSALLQRIGRSGRRKGCVRVLPIAKNRLEARAFASMLDTAFQGRLEPTPSARLWSVFVQQAASHTAQAGDIGRRREDLLELAQEVWPESGRPSTASQVLDSLVEQGILEENRGRLFLGASWSDSVESPGGGLHNNFESGGGGVPVIDSATGEVLTHVANLPKSSGIVALAGQRWDVVSEGGEIIVKASRSKGDSETFRYAARSAPTPMSFAEHVRRGLGFEDVEAPLVDVGTTTLWFHFGGSAYESVLVSYFPKLKRVKGLAGLALNGSISEASVQELLKDKSGLNSFLNKAADGLVSALSLGRYHSYLPDDVRRSVTLNFFEPDKFVEWLGSRKISLLRETDVKCRKLLSDLI